MGEHREDPPPESPPARAEREQRLVFGEVADTYDRVRPGYPDALIDRVIDFAALDHDAPVLEVGCGTGRATELLARRGVTLLALEPSPAMGQIARQRCADYPGVRVETTTFEDWPVPADGVALLASAQAWHWVTPATRAPKAAAVVRPHGGVALWWNRVHWAPGDPARTALAELYARLVPELVAQHPGFPGLSRRHQEPLGVDELDASEQFDAVTRDDYAWDETYPAARYVELLQTQSNHRLLPDRVRAELLDAVAALIAERGGSLRVPYVAELYLTRRR